MLPFHTEHDHQFPMHELNLSVLSSCQDVAINGAIFPMSNHHRAFHLHGKPDWGSCPEYEELFFSNDPHYTLRKKCCFCCVTSNKKALNLVILADLTFLYSKSAWPGITQLIIYYVNVAHHLVGTNLMHRVKLRVYVIQFIL